jgi:hypothetical protein
MFSDIFAFGDSFIAGTELSAEKIPGIREELIKKFKVVYTSDGRINNLDNLHNVKDIFTYVYEAILVEFGPQIYADYKLSFVNKLAQSFNISSHNYSIPGSGMVNILHQLTTNLETIKKSKNPFVIVGITGANRYSQFRHNSIQNILPYYKDPKLSKLQQQDLDTFNRLTFEFGDDALSRLTHRTSHLCFIGYLLKDIPHIIIDSYGDVLNESMYNKFYVTSYDSSHNRKILENDIRKDYAAHLRTFNTDLLFPVSICELANNAGENSYCLFWHPREHIHSIMSDKIKEYIEHTYV